MDEQRIAVLIPCKNEETTIATVVTDFRQALPDAKVYVYDNNSADRTATLAADAGAIVRREPLQGKGNVVRRMFADIEADIYLMVDGDDTYDATSAPIFISTLKENSLDMVSGRRVTDIKTAYRTGHMLGNRLLTGMVALIFGNRFQDMLSGYRVFSRRFVKSFPALTTGFEIETELTVHALELCMAVEEVDTNYKERPPGSTSKLSTVGDGMKILRIILLLIKEERPLPFFSSIAGTLLVVAFVLAYPLLPTYLQTGQVPRFPTAILAVGLTLLSFLSLFTGLVLDTVTHGRRELKRLHYLTIQAVRADNSSH